jgi:hypothetical protein
MNVPRWARRIEVGPVYNVVGTVKNFFAVALGKPPVPQAWRGVAAWLAKNFHRTKRELRLPQDSFKGLDQGSSPSNPTMKLLPPTMYSIFNH